MFTFIETKLFTRLVAQYLSDAEYSELQKTLVENPERGVVIRGSGGVRKLRWRRTGAGKRGGVRIIYYANVREGVIWMLTIYAKNEVDEISPSVLKKIRREIDG